MRAWPEQHRVEVNSSGELWQSSTGQTSSVAIAGRFWLQEIRTLLARCARQLVQNCVRLGITEAPPFLHPHGAGRDQMAAWAGRSGERQVKSRCPGCTSQARLPTCIRTDAWLVLAWDPVGVSTQMPDIGSTAAATFSWMVQASTSGISRFPETLGLIPGSAGSPLGKALRAARITEMRLTSERRGYFGYLPVSKVDVESGLTFRPDPIMGVLVKTHEFQNDTTPAKRVEELAGALSRSAFYPFFANALQGIRLTAGAG